MVDKEDIQRLEKKIDTLERMLIRIENRFEFSGKIIYIKQEQELSEEK